MKSTTYSINLEFEQILELIRQLPEKEKIRLSKALTRDVTDTKLTALLEAFKTDELDQKTIDKGVESIRAEIYARAKEK